MLEIETPTVRVFLTSHFFPTLLLSPTDESTSDTSSYGNFRDVLNIEDTHIFSPTIRSPLRHRDRAQRQGLSTPSLLHHLGNPEWTKRRAEQLFYHISNEWLR